MVIQFLVHAAWLYSRRIQSSLHGRTYKAFTKTCLFGKSDSIHHHHHHHHHLEGVAYRSFCFHSSTLAFFEIASRRWCIESLVPPLDLQSDVCSKGRRFTFFRLSASGDSSAAPPGTGSRRSQDINRTRKTQSAPWAG